MIAARHARGSIDSALLKRDRICSHEWADFASRIVMVRRFLWFPLASVWFALAASEPARADSHDDLADRSAALRTDAVKAANAKDWVTCKDKAFAAWQLQKSPITAGLLGVCEAELGDDGAAAEHLDYAL